MDPTTKYEKTVSRFEKYLNGEEKSKATIEKYTRDVKAFLRFLGSSEISKEEAISYKQSLVGTYAPTSINSMLASVNAFLCFLGRKDCCVKQLKIQRKIFANEEKELTKAEYQRLLLAAESDRISMVLQTICGTGIRVSELQYITAEAVSSGKAVINCKNKTRIIFIPNKLQRVLKWYLKKYGITQGPVFITKNGKPLNRSNIWRDMKKLCEKANVDSNKVFPHNLRHLFARTFYSLENDIVRLADVLGHSSINTTRIYTMETGWQHRNSLERVQKILTT